MKTIAERVAELVAVAPPITPEQREAVVRAFSRRRGPIDNRPAGHGGGRSAL
jgi:hypothetical protein